MLQAKNRVVAPPVTPKIWRRPDPKFDDYTRNSSKKQSESKNQPQNNSRAQDFEKSNVFLKVSYAMTLEDSVIASCLVANQPSVN
jgi:hypothetical protein